MGETSLTGYEDMHSTFFCSIIRNIGVIAFVLQAALSGSLHLYCRLRYTSTPAGALLQIFQSLLSPAEPSSLPRKLSS